MFVFLIIDLVYATKFSHYNDNTSPFEIDVMIVNYRVVELFDSSFKINIYFHTHFPSKNFQNV